MSERSVIALVVGTRPEAIKMAPIHRALARSPVLEPVLISSGQHREILEGSLSSLELRADHDLALMVPDQTPNDVARRIFEGMPSLFSRLCPGAVVVQGDTTTALASALVAHHLQFPVAHVEAGFRTYDLASPFPEEANRQLVDRISTWCFAPTRTAEANLLAERIAPGCIHVVGSTAVDSLNWATPRSSVRLPASTLLITLHRRESFGAALEEILLGVRDFVDSTPGARVFWPVHPNPRVDQAAEGVFAGHPMVERVPPMAYVDFAGALASCRVVLTDSGGIQEEAPSFGKVLLVARDRTERTEQGEVGGSRVVGRSRAGIASALTDSWAEPEYGGPFPAPNPYGDGRASERIIAVLEQALRGSR